MMKNLERPTRKLRTTMVGFSMVVPSLLNVPETSASSSKAQQDTVGVEAFAAEAGSLCSRIYFDSDGDQCHQATPSAPKDTEESDIATFSSAMNDLGDRLRFDQ